MSKYLNNANNVSLIRRSNAALQNPVSPFSFGTGLFDDLPLLTSPFHVMERMQQDMDRLFSHVLEAPLENPSRSTALTPTATLLAPTVDVSETEKEYRLEIDLPGVAQDAIDVTVVEGTLSVRAEVKSQSGSNSESQDQTEPRQYHYRERRWGSFERIFHLPPDAQEDNIRADFTNGVLTLTIEKKVPQVQQTRGRRIAIGTDTLSYEGSSQIEARADSTSSGARSESKEGVAA